MKRKTRRRKNLCVILVLLVALLATLAVWQRNNIQAVRDFATYTQEELEDQLAQNDQQIKDTVQAIPEVTVREVTEEERQALRDGSLTHEELAQRLLGVKAELAVQGDKPEQPKPERPAVSEPAADPKPESTPPVSQPELQAPVTELEKAPEPTPEPQPPVEQPPVEQAPEVQQPVQQPVDDELSALIAKVYVLREEYLIALDNMQAEAIADYKAMSKEQRTKKKLAEFVSSYISKATALERECDEKMDAIIDQMKVILKASGGDMSLIDTVAYTYANEKSLKKAWYMSELEKRGLV